MNPEMSISSAKTSDHDDTVLDESDVEMGCSSPIGGAEEEQGEASAKQPTTDTTPPSRTMSSTTSCPSRSLTRSKSLSALGDDDDDSTFWSSSLAAHHQEPSFLYAFRLPHNHCAAAAAAAPAASASGAQSNSDAASDYNMVLDNYVEYADDTKIPRLRGRDADAMRAAIQNSHWLALSLAVTVSCVLTYSISNHTPQLSADVAQAVVITMVLATFPEVAASSGAGAFAGMASSDSIPNFGWLAVLAVAVSAVWWVFHRFKILVGCGGRLGTCAFIAMNLTVALFAMPARAVPWSLYYSTSLWSSSEQLELLPCILVVAACAALSALGGAVRLQSKMPLNPVQAPTTLALLGMLILEPTGCVYTEQIQAALAVGSFVAMASEQYLPTVLDFGAAGFLAGLWILLLDPFFLGFGGKKGFTSFCGFATYVALKKIVSIKRSGRAAARTQ